VSKMSKPTALHTEGTTKVSEWFNISDIAKKLYYSKSNSGIAVVITRPNCKQGLKAEVYFYQKSKDKKKEIKNTHTQVHRSGFRESARVKWSHDGTWLRQVGAERVQDSKATTWKGVAGCKIEAQCKSEVGADSMSSLTIATGERRGALGMGFENMRRSRVMK